MKSKQYSARTLIMQTHLSSDQIRTVTTLDKLYLREVLFANFFRDVKRKKFYCS